MQGDLFPPDSLDAALLDLACAARVLARLGPRLTLHERRRIRGELALLLRLLDSFQLHREIAERFAARYAPRPPLVPPSMTTRRRRRRRDRAGGGHEGAPPAPAVHDAEP